VEGVVGGSEDVVEGLETDVDEVEDAFGTENGDESGGGGGGGEGDVGGGDGGVGGEGGGFGVDDGRGDGGEDNGYIVEQSSNFLLITCHSLMNLLQVENEVEREEVLLFSNSHSKHSKY
jgi:hypothetical protein